MIFWPLTRNQLNQSFLPGSQINPELFDEVQIVGSILAPNTSATGTNLDKAECLLL
jgi:hypothetical protein